MNKKSERVKEQESKKALWWENKIERTRSFLKPYAARASRFGAPAGVALLVAITLYSLFSPKDRFQEAKERILKNPKDINAHLVLAEEFLNNNQIPEAQQELLAAQQIESSSNLAMGQTKVLGVTSRLVDLWEKWREANPEEIQKRITAWEKFVSENPTYRDGYLRLALYYQRLKYLEEARVNLAKALDLDPSFPGSKKLQEILGE